MIFGRLQDRTPNQYSLEQNELCYIQINGVQNFSHKPIVLGRVHYSKKASLLSKQLH